MFRNRSNKLGKDLLCELLLGGRGVSILVGLNEQSISFVVRTSLRKFFEGSVFRVPVYLQV